jgi:hypothetical protein
LPVALLVVSRWLLPDGPQLQSIIAGHLPGQLLHRQQRQHRAPAGQGEQAAVGISAGNRLWRLVATAAMGAAKLLLLLLLLLWG